MGQRILGAEKHNGQQTQLKLYGKCERGVKLKHSSGTSQLMWCKHTAFQISDLIQK